MLSALFIGEGSAMPAGWQSILALRLKRHLVVKFVGITAFTWLFLVGYFSLLRDPASPPLLLPLTALDRWIPFQPSMLVAYASLWFYAGIAPGLQLRLIDLVSYGAWAALLCGAGLGLFYFFPT